MAIPKEILQKKKCFVLTTAAHLRLKNGIVLFYILNDRSIYRNTDLKGNGGRSKFASIFDENRKIVFTVRKKKRKKNLRSRTSFFFNYSKPRKFEINR